MSREGGKEGITKGSGGKVQLLGEIALKGVILEDKERDR